MPVPNTITLRGEKGSPLTPAEVDANFTTLRDFCNGLEDRVAAALGTTGKLKDGAISSATMFADRVITAAKLEYLATEFVSYDTGEVNAIKIVSVPPLTTALVQGMRFTTGVKYANTGAVTVQMDGGAITPLKKLYNVDMDSGDLAAGQILSCFFDGTNWQVENTLASGGASPITFLASPSTIATGTASTSGWVTATISVGNFPVTSKFAILRFFLHTSADPLNLDNEWLVRKAATFIEIQAMERSGNTQPVQSDCIIIVPMKVVTGTSPSVTFQHKLTLSVASIAWSIKLLGHIE